MTTSAPGPLEDGGHLGGGRGDALDGAEAERRLAVAHQGRDAVEHGAGRYRHAVVDDGRLQALGVVRPGKDGLRQGQSDLALVDVKGRDHLDVGGRVAAEVGQQDAHRRLAMFAAIGNALDERTGAIANADNR